MNNNSSLKEQLDQINEVMKGHRDRKTELNTELTALIQDRDAQMGNSQEMYAQRDELNNKVKECIQERNELRDQFRADERKFYEYQKELKNLRWEKQRQEREEREKEWQQERRKREAEKQDDQPFVAETTLLEQTIKFCKSFQPKETTTRTRGEGEGMAAGEAQKGSGKAGRPTFRCRNNDKNERRGRRNGSRRGAKGKQKSRTTNLSLQKPLFLSRQSSFARASSQKKRKRRSRSRRQSTTTRRMRWF